MSVRCVPAALLLVGGIWLGPMVRHLAAQTEGAVSGKVVESDSKRALGGAQVQVDDRVEGVTDTAGEYRIRAVRAGWHRVTARMIGFRGVVRDSVLVRAGATVTVDFGLDPNPQQLEPVVVTAPIDELLDPLATSTEQKISAADLRDLPVSSLDEALELSAGSVGRSYRGGRLGEESLVLDGLGVKNQPDASSGGLGLQIPPDFLGEASLVTNGFSARYGEALSGLVNVVTLEPGSSWAGRAAYEGDRPFGGSLDRGLDRLSARAGVRSRDPSAWSRPWTCRGGSTMTRSTRRPRTTRAIPARRARTRCRTTAVSTGTAPPSWSCPCPRGWHSGPRAFTRRLSSSSTTRPTSTIPTSLPASGCGAIC